jgi:2-dehydropantoate 2-reductase
MRIAIIGAGAIGAVIAGAARDSGHDVWVCVRTPIDSLVLERDGEEQTLGVHIASSPSELPAGPVDILWITTKATDTASAASWIGAACGPQTLVASAQNGLDHSARLADWVPAQQVAPTLAYVAAERLSPGRVRHLAGNLLVVPEPAGATITDAVSEGGLLVRSTGDMLTACWRKLLGNLVANPITALTRRRIGVMREEGVAELARGLLSEAVEVGVAEGARLSQRDIDVVVEGTTTYGDTTGSSMLYDILDGRPLEYRYITGEVVRRGRAHGIATPLNSTIFTLLSALDQGRGDTH